MKKHFLWLLLLLFQIGFSQQNLNWKGYFSYNSIKDVSESSTRMYAAAENALFTKNLATNELKTINTIDGLSGQTISAMYHSEAFNKTVIGYQNGLMVVINDVDGSILNVVDIINKNIPANIKKINHFTEHEGILYISCDFGIVQYRLATLQFGDTYFIGPNGQEIKVYQTAIFNNDIYAVTQNNGIRKASINNPNLIDFAQWQVFDSGFWSGLVTFNNQLIGMGVNNILYVHNGAFFSQFSTLGQSGLDIRISSGYLIVTTANRVLVFNQGLSQIINIQNSQITASPVTFTCATVIDATIYIGTNENGIVSATIANPSAFEFIMPDGPLLNNMFAINSSSTSLWAVYGGYNILYNPFEYIGSGLNTFGVSRYNETDGWLNIPYSELFGARALVRIAINPNDEKQVYIASYNDGLLHINDDIPAGIFNETNSSLLRTAAGQIRGNSTTFDRSGNLWMTASRVAKSLNVMKTGGSWQSYDMTSILTSTTANNDFCKIAIDRTGTKWIASYQNGVIAFNENSTVGFKKMTEGVETGNLPSEDVRAIAVDNRGQVWIGTRKGLRVVSSGAYNSDEQMEGREIIFVENGLPRELLEQQFITDIAVNGSNQKWISTADSGVFFFSANGQETIYHFTTANSPLPSNNVSDIEINAATGEVFFATDRGLVSFKGVSTRPAESLDNVYVYPNPVRPNFDGTVKVAGLISKANVKITDIEGNLVYETTSEGGTIEWDTTAFGKHKVASGVYLIFIAAEDASETAVKKVMIVR
ncbi:type IX secretion system anionic LPS delivery protein PorZ [Flavobacterium sp.]